MNKQEKYILGNRIIYPYKGSFDFFSEYNSDRLNLHALAEDIYWSINEKKDSFNNFLEEDAQKALAQDGIGSIYDVLTKGNKVGSKPKTPGIIARIRNILGFDFMNYLQKDTPDEIKRECLKLLKVLYYFIELADTNVLNLLKKKSLDSYSNLYNPYPFFKEVTDLIRILEDVLAKDIEADENELIYGPQYACMNWFWEEDVTHRLMFLLADNDQDEKHKVRNLNNKLEELLNGLEITDPKRAYDNHPVYAFKNFLQIYCLKVEHEATMRILTWLEGKALGKIKLLDEKYRTSLFKKFERMGFMHTVVDEPFLDDDLFMCDDMFLDDDLFICNDLIGSVNTEKEGVSWEEAFNSIYCNDEAIAIILGHEEPFSEKELKKIEKDFDVFYMVWKYCSEIYDAEDLLGLGAENVYVMASAISILQMIYACKESGLQYKSASLSDKNTKYSLYSTFRRWNQYESEAYVPSPGFDGVSEERMHGEVRMLAYVFFQVLYMRNAVTDEVFGEYMRYRKLYKKLQIELCKFINQDEHYEMFLKIKSEIQMITRAKTE